jgi:hypothetical protein
MKVILRFEKPFWIKHKNGDLRMHRSVGPFDTENKARLWMLKARGILEAANAGDATLEVLDDPDTL